MRSEFGQDREGAKDGFLPCPEPRRHFGRKHEDRLGRRALHRIEREKQIAEQIRLDGDHGRAVPRCVMRPAPPAEIRPYSFAFSYVT